MASRAERALIDWLAELPALAVALGAEPGARKVLLEDAASDVAILDKATDAHPVARARAHLAHAAIQAALAEVASGEAAAKKAVAHCEEALSIGAGLAASGPRLEIVTQAGALACSASPMLRHSDRRAVLRLARDVVDEAGRALVEQAETAHRGTTTLVAAEALAEGASVVSGRAQAAVRARAAALAHDAYVDLARAGELGKAARAANLAERLDS